MKKFCFFLILFFKYFQAFTQGSLNSGIENTPGTNVKSQYINNQDYLFNSSQVKNKIYFGDSLNGFHEEEIKTDLISRSYYGQELQFLLNSYRRSYINSKYSIEPSLQSNATKIIGNGSGINNFPCYNEDFEMSSAGQYTTTSAIPGWTVEGATTPTLTCMNYSSTVWNQTPEFWIQQTPLTGVPYIGNILTSPLGGTKIAQLNDQTPGATMTRMRSSFPVTPGNSVFCFAYCGSWDGGGHPCCEQPFFKLNLYNCIGNLQSCISFSMIPAGSMCVTGISGYSITNNVSWTNWQIKYIDLTPYLSSCVTLEFVVGDCPGGTHHGSLYFDATCFGQYAPVCFPYINPINPVSYCPATGIATINGPTGYSSYNWLAPPFSPIISSPNSQNISILNPIVNSVYTVVLNASSNCQTTATFAIVPTTVIAASILTASTCIGGASGTSTVLGNGSGTGYNYQWLNATNSVVSTSSIAANLGAGVYTVFLTASGASSLSCGMASITTTVNISPPNEITLIKPYCGNEAYICVNGGNNYQWFNNFTPIPPPLGIASCFTIIAPTSSSVYRLKYVSPQGCTDSLKFITTLLNPGSLTAVTNKTICLGANTGTATISMNPATYQAGLNYFTVNSTGATPTYSWNALNTSQLTYTLGNLTGGGTYTVNAFDGACKYATVLNIPASQIFYSLIPANSPSLCQGNSIAASINFTSTPPNGLYTYSWSPATFLSGGIINNQNTIITPSASPGSQSTIIYSIVVTSSVMNCSLTKTLAITIINPVTPTLSAIPPLCANTSSYNIISIPAGGIFTGNPGVTSGGLINPAINPLGINSVNYQTTTGTCVASTNATFVVFPTPTLMLSATPSICSGESATLSITGALTYSLNTLSTNSTIVVSPINTTTYIVSGTDMNNCTSNKILIVNVSSCTGIFEYDRGNKLKVYPNPTSGLILIENSIQGELFIYNCEGKKILSIQIKEGEQSLDLSGLDPGIYFLRLCGQNNFGGYKIVLAR